MIILGTMNQEEEEEEEEYEGSLDYISTPSYTTLRPLVRRQGARTRCRFLIYTTL
jgi:hypothetical protein